jgi:hypothetical protein
MGDLLKVERVDFSSLKARGRLGRQRAFANGRAGSSPGEWRYKRVMTQGDRRAWLGGWAADFVAVTVVGAILGLLGPFGNFLNGPAWQRIVYWVAMVWLAVAVYGAGVRLILARNYRPRVTWAALALLVAIMSAPLALASWLVASSMWPELKQVRSLTPLVWYAEWLLIAAPQVAVFAVVMGRRRASRTAGAPRSTAGLLGVPPREVLCLQMEDHYVRVHTAGGSRLVLATLNQAIAALGGTPGLRVHRSWWVADRGVAAPAPDGRNVRLILTNGLVAPVARSYVAAVRSAGWLQRGGASGHEDVVIAAAFTARRR